MKIPSRRKLAAAGLIIAGLGAFLVPFLLHGPNTQATSPNGGNNGGGNNHNTNPGGSTTSSTNPSSNSNPNSNSNTSGTTGERGDNEGSGSQESQGSNSGNCTASSSDPVGTKEVQHGRAGDLGKHKGLSRQTADLVQQMFSFNDKHNPAFSEHKSTRTDNDPVHTHTNQGNSSSHSNNDCSDDREDDSDD